MLINMTGESVYVPICANKDALLATLDADFIVYCTRHANKGKLGSWTG